MADVLISTGPGTAPGTVSHLDASWAGNAPEPNVPVQVRLSKFGVVPENDMNWNVARVDGMGERRMWFRDAGTQNHHGPKVLQLAQPVAEVQVFVKGDVQNQPAPSVTAWTVAAMPSTDVRALAATISQTFAGAEWFLKNEGVVEDQSFAKAATSPTAWYLQPSALAPPSLNDFLSTVIDGNSLKAGDAILRMWNGIANTGWKASLSSTLLAWLYDFSKMYLQPNATDPFNLSALQNTLYGQLYNRSPAYKSYFDSKAPGATPIAPPPNFGTGDPPPANPPSAPHPHKPPPRPHK